MHLRHFAPVFVHACRKTTEKRYTHLRIHQTTKKVRNWQNTMIIASSGNVCIFFKIMLHTEEEEDVEFNV